MEKDESAPTGEQGPAIKGAEELLRDVERGEELKAMPPVASAAAAEKTVANTDRAIDVLLNAVKSGELDIDAARKQVGELMLKGAAAALHFASKSTQQLKDPNTGKRPEWAVLPAEAIVPKGRPVVYVRFRSVWTDMPEHGVTMPDRDGLWRWVAMWPLTDSEEHLALQRSASDGNRVVREQTKQMVRFVDGKPADWSGRMSEPSSVDRFWNEIGSRCRQLLMRVYAQLSVLSQADQVDFFENCVEVRIGG